MNDTSWMNNPALAGIDPERLQTLSSLARQAQGMSQSELLPFFMSLAQSGAGNVSFDAAETDAIIQALKNGKTPEEIRKIDRILSIMKKRDVRSPAPTRQPL
ncbi:MAG: hypothetical protein LUF35_05455 [Lachnospiraceae bacterium]|nr:hypothetical protein [Lachnospiraceae bacterium]